FGGRQRWCLSSALCSRGGGCLGFCLFSGCLRIDEHFVAECNAVEDGLASEWPRQPGCAVLVAVAALEADRLFPRQRLHPADRKEPFGVVVIERGNVGKGGCLIRCGCEGYLLALDLDVEVAQRRWRGGDDAAPDVAAPGQVHEDAAADWQLLEGSGVPAAPAGADIAVAARVFPVVRLALTEAEVPILPVPRRLPLLLPPSAAHRRLLDSVNQPGTGQIL